MMLNRRAFMRSSRFEARPLEADSRRWLIAELDKLTSIIVRKRDRRCVTCGSYQGLQCSHFYSRRYLAIRFNLVNCNAQCRDCNRLHNTDTAPYQRYMQARYGEEAVAALDRLRLGLQKVTDSELKMLLGQYKQLM